MTHKEIEKWLGRFSIFNYTITPDSVVNVNGSVKLCRCKYESLPVQFGEVTGHFWLANDSNVLSFKGFPHTVGGQLGFNGSRVKSLSGINKIVKRVDGVVVCNKNTTHILGLLLIKGPTKIEIDSDGPINQIMNKYVGTGDILSAQDELIDAGFIDQARL
jgi:hypothetical protein